MSNSAANCLRRTFRNPATKVGYLRRGIGRKTIVDYCGTFTACFSTAAGKKPSKPWLLVHDPIEESHSPSSKRYYYLRNLCGDTIIKKRDRRFDYVSDSDLPKHTGRYFGCSKEWVSCSVPPSTYDSKPCHQLFNIFSPRRIHLPSIDIDPVMEPPRFPSTYGLEKLVVMYEEEEEEDMCKSRLMAIIGRSRSLATCLLGYNKIGAFQEPKTWTMLQMEPDRNCDYRDIIYSNQDKCLYAIRGEFSSHYWIESWDIHDIECPKRNLIRASLDHHHPDIGVEEFQSRLMNSMTEKRSYLVESHGDIYLVLRFLPRRRLASRKEEEEKEQLLVEKENTGRKLTYVYKLDKTAQEWKYVRSLGDQAFFIGAANHPFSVDATDFPGVMNRNSIYFIDENFQDGHVVGVHNLKTGVEEELFSNRNNPTVAPPAWIQSIRCSLL